MFLQKHININFEDVSFVKDSKNHTTTNYFDPDLLEYTRGHSFALPKPTGYNLKRAVLFLQNSKVQPQNIVFAGTDELVNQYITSSAAMRSAQAYTSKWVPGLFGNWDSCTQRVQEYLELEKQATAMAVSHFRQKKSSQALLEDRNYSFCVNRLRRLSLRWEGLKNLNDRPLILVNLSGSRLSGASKEASRDAVPVVSLVDWETRDMNAVNYPIPCDTRNTVLVSFIANVLSNAVAKNLQAA